MMSVPLNEPPADQSVLDFGQDEHDYARSSKDNEQVKENLQCCLEGMELIKGHEEAMFADGIITKEKVFVPKLEKALLEFGSGDACQGLFYLTFFMHQQQKIARIIETGCFEGVSSDARCVSVLKAACQSNGLLLYELYSKADITDTATRLEARHQNISMKRKKSVSGDAKFNYRCTERFKRLLHLIKPHLDNLQTRASEGTCLQGGILQLVKKGCNDGHRDDRYYRSFGIVDKEKVERTLYQFRFQGTIPERQELFLKRDLSPSPSLQTQLSALSSLSNNPAMKLPVAYRGKGQLMTAGPSLVQHFSCGFKECHWLPVSLRNRLIYFVTREDSAEVEKLLPYVVAAGVENTPEPADNDESEVTVHQQVKPTSVPVVSKRQYSARQTKFNPKPIQRKWKKVGGDCPLAENMSSVELTDYQAYTANLLESGQLLWRMHDVEREAFIMNAYNAQSGVFQPLEFVHTEIFNGAFHCGCETFQLLQTMVGDACHTALAHVTCLHCRFLREQVVPIIQRMNSCCEWAPSTRLEHKLQDSRALTNARVVVVSAFSAGPGKFSVWGSDDVLSFVTLSRHGTFVSCTLPHCGAQSGSKCSVKKLWLLPEDLSLCAHLSVFRTYDEVWRSFACVSDSPEEEGGAGDTAGPQSTEDDNQVDNGEEDSIIYFNPASGLWDFGGLSKHTPTSEIDPKMTRSIRQRLQYMSGSYVLNPQGFLTGVVLKPPVPDSCLCGLGYKAVSETDGTNLRPYPDLAPTVLFTRHAAIKCTVAYRTCRAGLCTTHYDPAEDSVHFLSKETCICDELGYDFAHRIATTKTSFTAFCSDMTRIYKSNNPRAAAFVSVHTFVHWWFSWAAAFKIDFRSQANSSGPSAEEAFKARLQCVKYTGMHLSKPKFTFLKQFMLHQWSKEKTETHQKKMMVAMNGAR